ncbi:hypothetical protein FGW37_05410 [Streptomyces rectiverticillatus]|uniref:Gp37-like protein n=1 Tax=Streptomyces rectiverticillatus TaxID=173860 RepID=UPI001FEBFD21|nr:siphovirus ReqiPepy6 Gp37-like family protein [Streptomyces rectiverticillatus]QLE71114.1 hypothetical protein FGW37_05410 [Streptomyces rectiverticillatus]
MSYRVVVRGTPDENGNIPAIGEIDTWMKLDLVIRLNQQGSWQLLIKAGTPQAELLDRGGGIAVYQDDVPEPIFSGQIETIQKYWTNQQHPGEGSLYIGGKCDNAIPYGYLALPAVSGAGTDRMTPLPIKDQWRGQDKRTVGFSAGQALWTEADMAWGSRALPGRKRPEVDVGRNPSVPDPIGKDVGGTLRYDNLGTLFESWCKDRDTGYRLLWNPNSKRIELRVFKPRDLSKEIRFSPDLGNLREFIWTLSGPRTTRAIIACQGEGSDRYVSQKIDAEGETQWRYVRETFVDRRDIPLKTGKDGQAELVVKKNSDGSEELGTGPDGNEWTPELAKAKAASAEAAKQLEEANRKLQEATTDEEKRKATAAVTAATTRAAAASVQLVQATESAKHVAVDHFLKAVDDAATAALREGEKNGNFQIYPVNTTQVQFGRDYFVGDIVTVAVDGEEYADVVREVNISIEDGGRTETVTPKIGQQGIGDPLNLYRTVWEMREKLRKMEARM